jgi:hypothetical protein
LKKLLLNVEKKLLNLQMAQNVLEHLLKVDIQFNLYQHLLLLKMMKLIIIKLGVIIKMKYYSIVERPYQEHLSLTE